MVRRETADCMECPLGELGLPRCVGFGPEDAEVAVVGINPSVRATDGVLGSFLIPYLAVFQRLGRVPPGPLYQGATRAFWHLAIEAGVELGGFYSTNLVKCATPANRRPTPKEVETCARIHLTTELEGLKNLRAVLAFGRVVGDHLGLSDFGSRATIEGTIAEGILLPHPIATLRKWTTLDERAATIRSFLKSSASR